MNIKAETRKNILNKLTSLYSNEKSEKILNNILHLIKKYKSKLQIIKNTNNEWISERDVYLITYGDTIKEENKKPLKTLKSFLNKYIKGIINNIHILPFYPYSSDDGFSVIDFFKVNSDVGTWKNIKNISKNFKLMFDAIINHISSESKWFQEYLHGNLDYSSFFIEVDPAVDLSIVTRPRALPLLTKFNTSTGEKYIWTTFSKDQIDLNYKNQKVFLKIIELLLFYVIKGAKTIRLDAIGLLWKEIGTTCIHLSQTHNVIQLFRIILDLFCPGTILITETNVPHKENISYFGNGINEAHMVYQFSFPPLVLNAFQTEDSRHLSKWAKSIFPVSKKTGYFNFLSSHDGIGLMPVKDILSEKEIEQMCKRAKENGGQVSYKANSDGTESPYELNINYFNALSNPDEKQEIKIKKIISAHAILLSFIGVPAIYIHNLLGSSNYKEGVKITGRYRTINREKLNKESLYKELADKKSIRNIIFNKICSIIELRKKEKAFHPNAMQKVVSSGNKIFSFIRISCDKKEFIFTFYNITNKPQNIKCALKKYILDEEIKLTDLISGQMHIVKDHIFNTGLKPYQFMWLKISNK